MKTTFEAWSRAAAGFCGALLLAGGCAAAQPRPATAGPAATAAAPQAAAAPEAKPAAPAPEAPASDPDTPQNTETSEAPESRPADPKQPLQFGQSAEAAPARAELAPPDGVWLTDETGQQYYLDKLEKQEGTYRRMDGSKVRTRWGVVVEVVKEDDQYFYYKIYKPEVAAAPNLQQKALDAEQIAAAYRAEIPEVDRLAFTAFSQGLPTSGQWRNGFDLADMNGDGFLDVVHGPARKSFSRPTIFLGDGKGTWRRWREAQFTPLAYDYGTAAAADLNGDGHQDVVLGVHLHGLIALLGDGKGNFTNWSDGLDFVVATGKPGDGGGFSTRALKIADWNGDKRPDIIALGEGPRLNVASGKGEGGPPGSSQSYGVVVYLNQPDGKWKRFDQGTGKVNPFGDSIVTADFNGDRRPDFLVGTNAMGRSDLLGLNQPQGAKKDREGWEQVTLDLVRPRSFVRAVATADFDGDKRLDLALAYSSFEGAVWRTGIDVLLNRLDRGGKWERRIATVEETRKGFFALGTGDADGDGKADLVALTEEGKTAVLLGDGKGGFSRQKTVPPPYPGGCRGYAVALRDLDGDGRSELVSSFAGEASAMFAPLLCPSGGGITAWKIGTK